MENGQRKRVATNSSHHGQNDEEMTDNETSSSAPSKIYNCVDCTRMFMSAEAHANHLRDVHGGEGGSVVLKLPSDKTKEKKMENSKDDIDEDDKVDDDELVIDDTQ